MLNSVSVVLLLLSFWSSLSHAQDLQPVARQTFSELKITLSESERQWLSQKKLLVVGVSEEPLPPYRIFAENQQFEGLMADYLVALQR
ncbi:hypothetical protein DBR29_14545, partial [Pseudomonas sp. HMWF005]